jgi:hypothetical protein
MSTTEKLPKWASLLLTLLIGMMITFGGQFFIARAASTTTVTKCTLEKGAGTTKLMLSGTIKNGTNGSTLATDLNKVKPFHLKCQ